MNRAQAASTSDAFVPSASTASGTIPVDGPQIYYSYTTPH
jgi:hypothetical protein